MEKSPEADLMEYMAHLLTDAKQYGLELEVLAWAFMDLSKDHKRIKEALDNGYYEWVK